MYKIDEGVASELITYLNLGCSGSGAFYDDETQVFLETDRHVLYAIELGINRSAVRASVSRLQASAVCPAASSKVFCSVLLTQPGFLEKITVAIALKLYL